MRSKWKVLWQGICVWGLSCALPIVAAQDIAATEGVTSSQALRAYSVLIDSIYILPTAQLASQFAAEIGQSLSPEQQKLVAGTLQRMRSRGRSSSSFYRSYFQSIEAALLSDQIAGARLTHFLEMQQQAAHSYSVQNYQRFLGFLINFFREGLLYVAPQQRWRLAPGASIDFSFEEAQKIFPLPSDVVALPEPPLQELPLEDSTDEWTNYDDPWAEEQTQDAENQDGGGGNDDWGYEASEVEENIQHIDDWGAADPSAVKKWSQAKDPYSQTATAINETHLYEQIGMTVEPLPSFAGGAILQVKDARLLLKTPQDSVLIGPFTGKFSILSQQLQTSSGQMRWPSEHAALQGAALRFGTLNLHFPSGRMQAQQARLHAPQYVDDEIEGLFQAFMRKSKDFYPIFHSARSDISVQLPYPEASYQGGLTLRDNILLGEAANKQPGILGLGPEDAIHLKAKSRSFSFRREGIYAQGAATMLYHDSDSLYHPHMEFKYHPKSQHVLLIRKKPYHRSPFFSSYLGMYMQIDVLDWHMSSDSLSMYILAGQNRIPATFESEKYFSEGRYYSIRGMLPFHPLLAVVRFAKEAKTNTFLMTDVSTSYGLNLQQLRAGVQYLHEQQYLDYDSHIGMIRLHEKAFHTVFSALGHRDYDRLIIPSQVDGGDNASFNLAKREMLIHGVDRIYFTPDQKVYAEPKAGTLRLQKGKNFSFDGKLSSGTILYTGQEFEFDYNEYRVIMKEIDSMSLQVSKDIDLLSDNIDSLLQEASYAKEMEDVTVTTGSFEDTSGTLYIAPPSDRAGNHPASSYPLFDSKAEASVYFNDSRILGGAYDRSVRFEAPPFHVDSINHPKFTVVGFEGVFHAGPIMPPFQQKLSITPDKSLGFIHEVEYKVGYPLYGLPNSYVQGQLRFDTQGLQSQGSLEHQTTTLHSDKFTFYLDKVTADVEKGNVRPGSVTGLENTSYPLADFEQVKLLWWPEKDNMLLKTQSNPIRIYDDIATLTGTLNIKSKGAFASGKLRTDLARAESQYFHLKKSAYTSRQANFEILSTDPKKPAVRGKRIHLKYDVKKNIGHMRPERAGIPSIDFPYVQMKTSLYEAIWDHNAGTVHMKRPAHIPLSQSFFTSTHPDMEALSFQAEEATYSMDSSQLYAKGVPYLRVLGADIVPKDHRVLIRKDSDIEPFTDATLYINAENRNHTLVKGQIKVYSRNKFRGSADYQYANADADTFYITFDEFLLEEAKGDKGETEEVLVSEGVIPEAQQFKASAGFYFKGDVKMFAHRKELFFDGFVKLALKSEGRNIQWIKYQSDTKVEGITIDFDKAKTEEGTPLSAGLHYKRDFSLYLTFMQDKDSIADMDLFVPEGLLRYDTERNFYVIQPEFKQKRRSKPGDLQIDPSYAPKTFMYSPRTETALFHGPIHLLSTDNYVDMQAAAYGKLKLKDSMCELEAALTLDTSLPPKVIGLLAKQVGELRNYTELKEAQYSMRFFTILSFLIGEKDAQNYETDQKESATPLYTASSKLRTEFMLSRVRLHWDSIRRTWYSEGPLQLSHITQSEVDADLQGYLQIQPRPKRTNIDMLLYFTPTHWYYLRYRQRNLSMYSGSGDFNQLVREQTKGRKPIPGKYSFTAGSAGKTEAFVQNFVSIYKKGATAWDMKYPDPVLLDMPSKKTTISTPQDSTQAESEDAKKGTVSAPQDKVESDPEEPNEKDGELK